MSEQDNKNDKSGSRIIGLSPKESMEKIRDILLGNSLGQYSANFNRRLDKIEQLLEQQSSALEQQYMDSLNNLQLSIEELEQRFLDQELKFTAALGKLSAQKLDKKQLFKLLETINQQLTNGD